MIRWHKIVSIGDVGDAFYFSVKCMARILCETKWILIQNLYLIFEGQINNYHMKEAGELTLK